MAKSKLISPKVKVASVRVFIGGENHCSLPAAGEDKELKALRTFKFPNPIVLVEKAGQWMNSRYRRQCQI